MINFIYAFKHPKFTPYSYKVIQYKEGDPFHVFSITDVLIGTIVKNQLGEWFQNAGREMPQQLVDGIGHYIDEDGK